MVDFGCEIYFGWLKRIVGGEMDGQEKDTALKWTVTLLKKLESERDLVMKGRVAVEGIASR